MKVAFALLTTAPQPETVLFLERLAQFNEKIDIWVVGENVAENKINGVSYIAPTDLTCWKSGFIGSNLSGFETHIEKPVISWDRFMYSFCCEPKLKDYGFVWAFEEDCLFESEKLITDLTEAYGEYDLVCANNFPAEVGRGDWHWPSVQSAINPPYFASMVCAVGISRRLLAEISDFVSTNGRLTHHEALLPTIAAQKGLKVINPLEFKTVVWLGEWNEKHMAVLPNNIFHPVKRISDHQSMREKASALRQSEACPTVEILPEFVKECI